MTTAGNETAVAEAAINEKKQNCWKATKKLSIRQTDDVKSFFSHVNSSFTLDIRRL